MATKHSVTHYALLGTAALLLCTRPVLADGDKPRRPPASDPVWMEECGSCHIAYPPRFLPAESWHRMMSSLADHFGTDATIEPARAATIEEFLVANARKPRSGETGAQAPQRITETRWFRGEHDEIAPGKWQSPAIKSPANCGACHGKADEGRFGERDISIP